MKIILSIVLLILSFHNILCVGCKYRVENDNNILITNSTYLAGYKDEEAKQRCYSLSNLDGENDLCCYDEIKKGLPFRKRLVIFFYWLIPFKLFNHPDKITINKQPISNGNTNKFSSEHTNTVEQAATPDKIKNKELEE